MKHLSELARSRRIRRANHGSQPRFRCNAACEGRSAARVRVLVVEHEAAYGRCWLRTIERCEGIATLVETAREAREQFASTGPPWTGLIVDVRLPDGSGLEFLSEARAGGVDVPAVIISGLRDNAVAHAAFRLDALYLVKPVDDIYVESLVHHASQRVAGVPAESRVQNVVADWTARHGLSKAEAGILLLAAEGHDRAGTARIRGCSEATVRNQITSLLQKTGDVCLREAVVCAFSNTKGTRIGLKSYCQGPWTQGYSLRALGNQYCNVLGRAPGTRTK
jgi:DNA-binding NarL/FixJ family response regulator